MKKRIRLSESDLVNLIEKVIQEQAKENSPECQKLAQKIKSHKAKGEKLINLIPQKLRSTFTTIFETGINEGPEAFKKEIPAQLKTKFEEKISQIRKPKTQSELDTMITKAENDAKNIQEQNVWLVPTIMILGLLFIIVQLIRGLMRSGEYCSGTPYRG